MEQTKPTALKSLRLTITLLVTVLIMGLLLWTHFHGGVPSHHLLNQKELPQISNWWGAIWLPVLTWTLMGKVQKRLAKQTAPGAQQQKSLISALGLFCVGMVFGIILSISFTTNYKPFLDNVLYLIFLLGLLVPIFFAEFILGFVIGMTYTFGAILPTIFILVVAAIGFLLYKFIRPLFKRLGNAFGKMGTTGQGG